MVENVTPMELKMTFFKLYDTQQEQANQFLRGLMK